MLAVVLGRHAVRAAEVAAVDDRDPQVAQRAGCAILHGCLRLPVCYRVRHPSVVSGGATPTWVRPPRIQARYLTALATPLYTRRHFAGLGGAKPRGWSAATRRSRPGRAAHSAPAGRSRTVAG